MPRSICRNCFHTAVMRRFGSSRPRPWHPQEANCKLGELNEMRNNTLAMLKDERQELSKLSKDIVKHRQTLKSLGDEETSKQSELQMKSASLDEAKADLGRLEKCIKEEEDKLECLKSEREEEKASHECLLKAREEIEKGNMAAVGERDDLRKQLVSLQAEIKDSRRWGLHWKTTSCCRPSSPFYARLCLSRAPVSQLMWTRKRKAKRDYVLSNCIIVDTRKSLSSGAQRTLLAT